MRIQITEMTDAERLAFAEAHVVDYAAARVAEGDWTADEAGAKSRQACAPLFAGGPALAGNTLLTATAEDGTAVGQIWVAPPPQFLAETPGRFRWLNMIVVDPTHRRRGHAAAMLTALHDRLADDGVNALWLRVSNANVAARALYDKLGYEVMRTFETDRHLRRQLPARHRQPEIEGEPL
ncbi:MAG: GNAT family N-acetyltransferase [Tepidisphaeraceae bacterium]